MNEVLFETAIPYGIFSVLFIWLLYTTNKRNECREAMYQRTIEKNQDIISEQAKAFTNLSGDIKDIKLMIKGENHHE